MNFKNIFKARDNDKRKCYAKNTWPAEAAAFAAVKLHIFRILVTLARFGPVLKQV
jgi:hypothetical protein